MAKKIPETTEQAQSKQEPKPQQEPSPRITGRLAQDGRVTSLPELDAASMADDDILYIIDRDVTTDGPQGSSRQIESGSFAWTNGNSVRIISTGAAELYLQPGETRIPSVPDGATFVDTESIQILENKTLIAPILDNPFLDEPTITDFTEAQHNHADVDDGGKIDHGALLGKGGDDHTQYHTNSRGDARYYRSDPASSIIYTKTQADGRFAERTHDHEESHSHDTVYSRLGHTHPPGEPDRVLTYIDVDTTERDYQGVTDVLFPSPAAPSMSSLLLQVSFYVIFEYSIFDPQEEPFHVAGQMTFSPVPDWEEALEQDYRFVRHNDGAMILNLMLEPNIEIPGAPMQIRMTNWGPITVRETRVSWSYKDFVI